MDAPRRAMTLAAVLLPAALLACVGAWFGADVPRPLSAGAVATDRMLAATPSPGMVIVGNSKVNSDIDKAALVTGIQWDSGVVAAWVAASSAPAWYAMLEQRVFDAGYRPELVVIYGSLAAMLRAEPGAALERQRIEEQLTRDSEVLNDKVFRIGGSSWPSRLRRRATALHTNLLDGLRNGAVGLLAGPGSTPDLLARGEAEAVPALERVLGGEATFRAAEATRVIPVAEREVSSAMQASDVGVEATLVPDLIGLAQAHGARIVFIRAPLPASFAHTDEVDAATEEAFLSLLNERGAGWLDLHDVVLPKGVYRDTRHLGIAGRRAFTAILIEVLNQHGGLAGPLPPARLPIRPASTTRSGQLEVITAPATPVSNHPCRWFIPAPELEFLSGEALRVAAMPEVTPLEVVVGDEVMTPFAKRQGFGDTCSSSWFHNRDGLHVSPPSADERPRVRFSAAPDSLDPAGGRHTFLGPEQALTFRFDRPVEQGEVTVAALVRLFTGSSATLTVAGEPVPLAPVGRLSRATLTTPVPTAPWTIELRAGPATWLHVTALSATTDRTTTLLGTEPVPAHLLAGERQWASAPEVTPLGPATVDDQGRRVYVTPNLAHLADAATRARIGTPCSPVRVAPSREPLDWTAVPNRAPDRLTAGRAALSHIGNLLLLPPASEAMPEGNYVRAFAANRACGTATWIHPGDRVTLPLWRRTSESLTIGADRVRLRAAAFRPGAGADAVFRLAVRTRVGKGPWEEHLDHAFRVPATGGLEWLEHTIEPPLPPRAGLEATIESLDPVASILLDDATLFESERAVEAEPALP